MKHPSLRVLALASLPALGACADTTDAPTGPTGPKVEVAVAPLTLPGATDVCYGITVYNGDPATSTPDTVWTQAGICSTKYGNGGGGDITYIGTCDANGSNNFVELVLESVKTASGTLDDQVTTVDGDADFENPCTAAQPCTLDFPCVENQDTLVEFNLTIMRDANQGFFDVAVNFEDIFCSAKFDTCYDVTYTTTATTTQILTSDGQTLNAYVYAQSGKQVYAVWTGSGWAIYEGAADNARLTTNMSGTGPVPPNTLSQGVVTWTLQGGTTTTSGDPISLLFGDDNDAGDTAAVLGDGPGRDWTGVLGFACTAGPGTGVETELMLSKILVSCGSTSFTLPVAGLAGGNHTVSVDLDADGTADTVQYALYYGAEGLNCDEVSCNKGYLNVALNLEDLPAGCVLSAQGTAQDTNDPVIGSAGTLTTTNTSYPAVTFGKIPLDQCAAHGLNAPGSQVQTTYGGNLNGLGTLATMCCGYIPAGGGTPTGISATGVTNLDYFNATRLDAKITQSLSELGKLERIGRMMKAACADTYANPYTVQGRLYNVHVLAAAQTATAIKIDTISAAALTEPELAVINNVLTYGIALEGKTQLLQIATFKHAEIASLAGKTFDARAFKEPIEKVYFYSRIAEGKEGDVGTVFATANRFNGYNVSASFSLVP